MGGNQVGDEAEAGSARSASSRTRLFGRWVPSGPLRVPSRGVCTAAPEVGSRAVCPGREFTDRVVSASPAMLVPALRGIQLILRRIESLGFEAAPPWAPWARLSTAPGPSRSWETR
jgi:hypothetical protein